MNEFRTFEDILDFAILQEKAAQEFYSDLAGKVQDEHVRIFYLELVQQEHIHEKKLMELKRYDYDLQEPDLESLRQSGYLNALPVSPEMTMEEAVQYAIMKEQSAQLLYTTLASMVDRAELAALFRTLAEQEQAHAAFFQTEYKGLVNPKQ